MKPTDTDALVTEEIVKAACDAYESAYAFANQVAMPKAMRAALLAVIPPLVRAEREREREECAKIADDEDGEFTWSGEDRNVRVGQRVASEIAAAIRARSTKETTDVR